MDDAESARNDPRTSDPRTSDPRKKLAGELLAVQEATGLSLKELERVTHVSDSSLSRYLAGRSVPPWPVVQTLCRLARRDPDALRAAWVAARGARLNTPRGAAAAGRDDLPRAPLAFVGRRTELGVLVAAPGVWVVDGMAGVGKSALAVRAARTVAEAGHRRSLYLHLHGHTAQRPPLTAEAALAALLGAIGVPEQRIPEDPDRRSALWRAEVARHSPVVLLDDAVSSAQVRPLLPGAADAVVLVTSRRRLLSLEGARSLTLAVPSLQECRELVDAIAGPQRRQAEPAAVDEIIEACGRLPLAVQLCAARLQHRPAWSAAFLASRLGDEGRRRRELAADGGGVAAALALSVAHLTEAERSAFAVLGSLPGGAFDTYTAAALFDAEPADAEDVLQVLVDAHLLEESVAGRYRLHDLTRDHARAMPEPAREAALARVVDYHIAAAAKASLAFDPYGSGQVILIRPDYPPDRLPDFADAPEAAAWFEENLPTLTQLSEAAGGTRTMGFLRNAARFIWLRGRSTDMVVLSRLAEAGTRGPGTEQDRAWALLMLGTGHLMAHRPDVGADHFELAVVHAADRDRGFLLNALAVTYSSLWRLADAREHGQEAVRHFQARSQRRGLGVALANLAEIATRQGRAEEALRYAAESLALFEAESYDAGRSTAHLMTADALRHTGDHHQALDHYRRALHLAENQSYFDNIADALRGLAVSHRDLGDTTRALEYHARVDTLLAGHDTTHPDQAEFLTERAHTEHAAGLPAAQASAEQALAAARESQNPYEEARASALLAELATANGEPDVARELRRRAAEIRAALGVGARDGAVAAEN